MTANINEGVVVAVDEFMIKGRAGVGKKENSNLNKLVHKG